MNKKWKRALVIFDPHDLCAEMMAFDESNTSSYEAYTGTNCTKLTDPSAEQQKTMLQC